MFSCKFCETFKNTSFCRTPLGSASATYYLKNSMNPISCLIKMKKMTGTLMFCVKPVDLLIFTNKKQNFHVKTILFFNKRLTKYLPNTK